MIKLHDGMETLPKYLAEYLINNTNTKIEYNTSIQDIDAVTGKINGESYDHIRSTINTHDLAKHYQQQIH